MRVAALDIGTNSIRLLVADVDGRDPVEVLRAEVVVGLGRGVDATGRLRPDRVAAALAALAQHRRRAEDLGARRLRAVATAASREAVNARSFLDAAADVLGVRPEVISGEEEAALSFLGATAGRVGRRPFLVVDPGGGSTELVLGDHRPEWAVSVPIGSVRLTERVLASRPASPREVAAARAEVDRIVAGILPPRRPGTVVGVGGTVASLAAIAAGRGWEDRAMVDGVVIGSETAGDLVADLARRSVAETAAIPSLDPARAPVLLAGAVVVDRVLAHLGAEELVTSVRDLLDGVVLGLTGRVP